MSDTVIIKRYQNRRLYDTEASAYVNIDHLAELVNEGRTIKVVDAKTGEDLTRRFLTQILLESENTLPLEILQQLGCVTDRAFREFLNWYLSSAVAVYQQVQDSWQTQLKDFATKGPTPGFGFPPAGKGAPGLGRMWDPTQVAEAMRERWESFMPPSQQDPAAEAEEAPPEDQPPAADPADMDRLSKRLAELEKKLSQLEDDA